jgi:uncharacterized membrane protein YkgB
VVVLLWIGGMKFTTYEAEDIKPLVVNSPLMDWVYGVMSVSHFAVLLEVAVNGPLPLLKSEWGERFIDKVAVDRGVGMVPRSSLKE